MENAQKPSRLLIVDALRGFALAGVALVHFTEQYIAGPAPQGFSEGLNSLPDQIISGFLFLFVSGKFFALFSVLFGLSFSIQTESAARRGSNFSGRFLWRAVLLFVIGYVHQLFYRGDILTIYALLVPFLIPFGKLENKHILLAAGLIFLGLPRFVAFALFGNESLFGLPSDFGGDNQYVSTYFKAISSGPISEVFRLNAGYGMQTKMDFQLLVFGRFYYTLGYFLVGLWLGRIGLFKQAEKFDKQLKKSLLWGSGLAIVGIVLTSLSFFLAPKPVNFSDWAPVLGINFMDWFHLGLTVIILSAFVLLYGRKSLHSKLAVFAPYGRMALSNYILQALIGTFLFFGWGLGLLGQLRTLYLFLLGLLVIALQMVMSKYWLRSFKYGPLEWLWRSGTYLKIQDFRKNEAAEKEVIA